jgi:hypothetical protein
MADPNPLAGMPFAESLAHQMNESLQWMSRMWGNPAAGSAGGESMFARQPPMPPGLPSMLMPTFDPQELEKRINDLKTVEHWLDMNRALLHSTIQTLEMQRNAIVAMQSMARPAPASPSAAGAGQVGSGTTSAASSQARGEAAAPLPFDPAPWWNALQEQFARLAAGAAPPNEPAATPAQPQSEGEAVPTQPAGERTAAPTGAGKPGRKGSGTPGTSN